METIVQTGFKLATSVISNGDVTGNKWIDPNNLLLVDGDVAESNPANGVASDIVIGNFNPDLPDTAVVTGIEIELIGYFGGPTSPAISISPNFLDNTSGEDVYMPYTAPFEGMTQALASYILGGSTYLFDQGSITVDQINNFKAQLLSSGDVYIDAVLLNVYYYVPVTPTPPSPGNRCSDCNSPIQAQPFTLALDMAPGDIVFYFESFNYPDGTPIQYTDLGACGGYIDLIFDPGVKSDGAGGNFEENAQTAVWEPQVNGTIKFTLGSIADRGLMFRTPYTHQNALLSGHNAGSQVIIGNSGAFYARFARSCSQSINVYNEIVAGSSTTFTLVHIPKAGTVRVYGGGSRLTLGTDYTINYTTGVITPAFGYSAGQVVADYQY